MRRLCLVLPASVLAVAALGAQSTTAPPDPSRAAWQELDLATSQPIASNRTDRVDAPTAPGSFMKLPALIAALASGALSPDTRVNCTGAATIGGEVIRCSHPRVRHALRPAEALALSCNVYFATIGERLSRSRLDGTLAALGLPPSPARVPMPLVATGLRATPVAPTALLRALARFVTNPRAVPLKPADRQVVIDGLRGSALYGTSGAFALRGVDALAKTGTATAAGGGEQGLVVAVWPATAPTRGIVLLAPGAAGMDAADLAAQIATRAMPAEGGAAVLSVARPSTPGPSPSARPQTRPAAPGEMVLRVGFAKAGGGYDVRSMPIEDYVSRVLAGEAQPRSAPAALEALAITARTFAISNRGRHQRNGFDLCTLTHCQVLREPDQAMRAAVAATTGQVLAFEGKPAQVFYTASCGGYTEKPSSVWPGAVDPPYLKVRHDRACDGEPHWASEISEADLVRVLHAAGFHGARLHDVKREGRTSSGRVKNIELSGLNPALLSAQDFRTIVGRGLGWQLIKSTDFTVRRTRGGFHFEGHGFGHGVGLCVIGSARRAGHGDSAESILDAYFPGAKIRPLASLDLGLPRQPVAPTQTLASGEGADVSPAIPGEAPAVVTPSTPVPVPAATPRSSATPVAASPAAVPSAAVSPPVVASATTAFSLVLPPTEESNRAPLTAIVDRAIRDTARATGRPAPTDLKLVFHPSSGSFGRETGEPWWSAARTRGSRIDLQPPDVLNQRGVLESTIRHEVAHVLTEPVLTGRPMWVREGAAMHFAGEQPPQGLVRGDGSDRKVGCPSDLDLQRPASAAQARQSYGLAATCFERALSATGDWTKVR